MSRLLACCSATSSSRHLLLRKHHLLWREFGGSVGVSLLLQHVHHMLLNLERRSANKWCEVQKTIRYQSNKENINSMGSTRPTRSTWAEQNKHKPPAGYAESVCLCCDNSVCTFCSLVLRYPLSVYLTLSSWRGERGGGERGREEERRRWGGGGGGGG